MVLSRPGVAVGLTALALMALVALALSGLYGSFLGARGELEHIEPRYARLAGLVRAEKALDRELAAVREQARQLALPADADADAAGARLQQDLRKLAEETGNTVSVSQVLARESGRDEHRLAIMLRVDGEIDALQRLLAAIERQRPLVFVDNLSVSRGRQRVGRSVGRSLTSQINLVAYRLPVQ